MGICRAVASAAPRTATSCALARLQELVLLRYQVFFTQREHLFSLLSERVDGAGCFDKMLTQGGSEEVLVIAAKTSTVVAWCCWPSANGNAATGRFKRALRSVDPSLQCVTADKILHQSS